MRAHTIRCLALAIAAPLVACRSPRAEAAGVPAVVTLHNGPNAVDLLGDGSTAQVFVARRDNGNAHGFSSVAFYVRQLAPEFGPPPDTLWQLVPFFGGPGDPPAGGDTFTTGEGADCALGDLRIVRRPTGPVQVVVAARELGASFADSARTTFTTYELRHNIEGVVGWPTYYFASVRTVPASHEYCDVNEAFARELHLGTTGVARAEGGR